MECNKCGQSLEYVNDMEVKFNYGSTFDGEQWQFTLCDKCLDQLANSFVYPPKGFMEDPYREYGEALQECINRGGLFE